MPKITIHVSPSNVSWFASADTPDDSLAALRATISALASLAPELQANARTTQARHVSRATDTRPALNWRAKRAYRWLLSQPNFSASAQLFWESQLCGVPTFKWLKDNGYIAHDGEGASAVFRALPAPQDAR